MYIFPLSFLSLSLSESNMGVEVVNQEAAANTLQYAWRVKKAYLIVRALRAERERKFIVKWDAAITIQKHLR